MNLKDLENMILEELMMEAEVSETDGEEYMKIVRELWPNLHKNEGDLQNIKIVYNTLDSLKAWKKLIDQAKITGEIDHDLNGDGEVTQDEIDAIHNVVKTRTKQAEEEGNNLQPVPWDQILAAANSSDDPPVEPTSEPTSEPTTEPASDPEEQNPDIFIQTDDVKKAVEDMMGFYGKPFLHEQGELLRAMINAIESSLKGTGQQAGITQTQTSFQEAKGLNINNIKASLNAFLQQTRQVKKALDEYIDMASQGKVGARRKKAILDREVDELIKYGKIILKSLPKNLEESDNKNSSSETVDLEPLHTFVNFVIGGKLDGINKEQVEKVVKAFKDSGVLNIFPNVAPFGTAEGRKLEEYKDEFKKAIGGNLKTAIANFKSLQSQEGGGAAIKGLRDAIIKFLGEGLAILGKNANGDDLKNLGQEDQAEPIEQEDQTAEQSPLSPESIMADLGLDTDKMITADSDDEEAFKITADIFGVFQSRRFNNLKKIENFIYDFVKKDEDRILKKLVKGTLRRIPFFNLRESSQIGNFKDEFSENFIKKIKEMYVNWKNKENKNELRAAAKELAKYSNNMLEKYQTLSDSEGNMNTGKKLSDMFTDLYKQHKSTFPDNYKESETEKKVNKALDLINKNIGKVDYKIFLKTLSKIDPQNIYGDISKKLEETSEKIFGAKLHFLNTSVIFGIKHYFDHDGTPTFIWHTTNFYPDKDSNSMKRKSKQVKDLIAESSLIHNSFKKWWETCGKNTGKVNENDLAINLTTGGKLLEKIKSLDFVTTQKLTSWGIKIGTKIKIVKIEKDEKKIKVFLDSETFNEKEIKIDPKDIFNCLKIDQESVTESINQQIQFKLEKLVENYINNRKQQWRKRTM